MAYFTKAGSTLKGDLYARILSALPMGVALFQDVGNYVQPLFLSDRLCDLTGMTYEQLENSFSPEHPYSILDDKTVMENVGKFARQEFGTPYYFSCSAKRPDDAVIWLRIVCSWALESNQTLFYVAVHEITEEVARSKSEQWLSERYRLLCEASETDIFDYDPADDILSVSLHKQSGKPDYFIIERFNEWLEHSRIIHPNDRVKCRDAIALVQRVGTTATIEIRMQQHELGYRWNKVAIKSVSDAAGKIVRIVGQAEDIQAEKEKELASAAKTRIEASYLRSILTNAMFALEFDLTDHARIVSEHDVCPEWLPNITYRELSQFLLQKSVHPADYSALNSILERSVCVEEDGKNPEAFQCRCRLRPIKGNTSEYRWYLVRQSLAVNEYNGHTHLFLSAADIHDEVREAEGNLIAANTDPGTGLMNRYAFERDLPSWALDCSAQSFFTQSTRLAIAMIQIEDLSEDEDAYAPNHEDRFMIRASKSIRTMLRPDERMCRYNVDMFALALVEWADIDVLHERMRVLHAALNARLDTGMHISASLALVPFPLTAFANGLKMRRVIRALRTAKAEVENRLVLCSSENDVAFIRRAEDQAEEASAIGATSGDDAASERKKIYVRTFGSFDVFVNGNAIPFSHAKARELFALLVDRKGGFVTAYDAIERLWEDDALDDVKMNRYRKAAMFLKNTLEENHAGEILEVVKGKRRILADQLDCDYYRYLARDEGALCYLPESYLTEYSWAERTIAYLEAIRRKR